MKTILITGASSGIGAACAERFLETGWIVGLLARSAEKLDKIARGRDRAIPLVCDVTDAEATDRTIRRFAKAAGKLDVVFNNAGQFGPAGEIDAIDLAELDATIDVNLKGMIHTARSAWSVMKAQTPQGGRIINNGSISAHVPRAHALAYTVTKHAITGLTRQLALDGRAVNIACGQIDIGNARTDLLDGIIARAEAEGAPAPATMDVADAVRGVETMAQMPLSANVLYMTVMATQMPYVGRG